MSEQPKATLYKVTGAAGEPLHGGSGNWPLPQDGKPGAWREEHGTTARTPAEGAEAKARSAP